MPFRHLILSLLLCLSALAHAAGEPLEPEKAFIFSARAVDASTVEARWKIADGYYMYKDKIRFSAAPGIKLGEIKLPAGKVKEDENFGKVETYRGELTILIPVQDGAAGGFTLKARSQGCWDEGVCYPPLDQQASIKLATATPNTTTVAPTTSPAPEPAARVAAANSTKAQSEESRIASLLHRDTLWLALASFFGFGLLLSFTPCVLPMVPILSGIIVNHGHAVTHTRAFVLSLAYVLGMALTYTAAGVAAGLSGTLLSAALQNPWVLGGFGLVFVMLSLSMFGFYELQLPAALQSRLSDSANQRAGGVPALFVMGALSALIVGPCVAAPLAGALLYIAQTGDAVLGGAALFAMALGMGVPLLVVGVFSRSFLPKTGPWMETVKKFFGILLLATALWLVSPVIPAWAQMLGWALLLIVPAIYLHALDPLPAHASGWHKLWKGVGVVILLAGTAILVGLLGGSRDPLQPLGFLRISAATESHGPKFERVASLAELDARLKSAGKPVLLDFYADWCVSCKEMEKFTFADPKVAAEMGKFLLLQADVTANTADDTALLKRFGLFGPPGIIFFDARGKESEGLRVVGYQPPETFLDALTKALKAGA
ncbi:MAG: protein-disulfide reductase DsbD [Rhodocyclaceae bacterium]|nr:protein-disulfide reductase DsbD [Rhodocyclaceae bacterium]